MKGVSSCSVNTIKDGVASLTVIGTVNKFVY